MKKIIILIFVALILTPHIVYSDEPAQDEVSVLQYIECPFYNYWCKWKKTTLNSAYEYQEENYIALNQTLSSYNLIQIIHYDDFTNSMHEFFIRMIQLFYEIWFVFIYFAFMTTGGDLYKEIKAKESLKNFFKGLGLIAFLPIIVVFINDFFFQINKVFISNQNYGELVLYTLKTTDNVFGFWVTSFLTDKIVLLLTGLLLFYKMLLYLSPILVTIIGALWFSPYNNSAKLLKDYLLLAYIHIPILIIILNSGSILVDSSLGYTATLLIFQVTLAIFILLNFYILAISFMNKFADNLKEATKHAMIHSSKELSSTLNKWDKSKQLKKEIKQEKQKIQQQEKELKTKSSNLDKRQNLLETNKDFADLITAHKEHSNSKK